MKIILRLLIGVLLLFIGFSLSYDCSNFELKLYELNFTSFYFSGIIARILIILYFVVGIFLILHRTTKALFFSAFALIFLIISFFFYDTFTQEIIVFNPLIIFNKSITIILLFLSVVLLFFSFSREELIKLKKLPIKISKYLLSLGAIVFVFVSNPVFVEEFQELTEASFVYEEDSLKALNQSDPNELAAFFSTACPYCELAAKRLMVLSKQNKNFPKIKVYFIGSEEGIEWFFEETNTRFEYQVLKQEDFLNITSGSYPKFILFNNSEPSLYYSGRTFNYTTPTILSSSN
jgi:thiol-disulfide isomerase/thioredoxin